MVVQTAPYEWDIDEIRNALGEEPKAEIKVPEKWERPSNLVCPELVMRKQNEIIDCLEQIKGEIEK